MRPQRLAAVFMIAALTTACAESAPHPSGQWFGRAEADGAVLPLEIDFGGGAPQVTLHTAEEAFVDKPADFALENDAVRFSVWAADKTVRFEGRRRRDRLSGRFSVSSDGPRPEKTRGRWFVDQSDSRVDLSSVAGAWRGFADVREGVAGLFLSLGAAGSEMTVRTDGGVFTAPLRRLRFNGRRLGFQIQLAETIVYFNGETDADPGALMGEVLVAESGKAKGAPGRWKLARDTPIARPAPTALAGKRWIGRLTHEKGAASVELTLKRGDSDWTAEATFARGDHYESPAIRDLIVRDGKISFAAQLQDVEAVFTGDIGPLMRGEAKLRGRNGEVESATWALIAF